MYPALGLFTQSTLTVHFTENPCPRLIKYILNNLVLLTCSYIITWTQITLTQSRKPGIKTIFSQKMVQFWVKLGKNACPRREYGFVLGRICSNIRSDLVITMSDFMISTDIVKLWTKEWCVNVMWNILGFKIHVPQIYLIYVTGDENWPHGCSFLYFTMLSML